MYNQTKTQTTSNDENKKRKLNENSSDSSGEESLSAGFVPFLVVEPVDKVNKINHSIFAVQKFATCSIGSIKSAKKLRSGSVLLEVRDHHQYDLAMALTKWVDVDVKVTEHRGLNSSRGVIRSRELRDCPDDEVLEALQSQKVTAVHHIKTKKDGLELPTNTFILTFRSPNPPTHITAAYMRIPVERYIPNPLRCYNCQSMVIAKLHVTAQLLVLDVVRKAMVTQIAQHQNTAATVKVATQLILNNVQNGNDNGILQE